MALSLTYSLWTFWWCTTHSDRKEMYGLLTLDVHLKSTLSINIMKTLFANTGNLLCDPRTSESEEIQVPNVRQHSYHNGDQATKGVSLKPQTNILYVIWVLSYIGTCIDLNPPVLGREGRSMESTCLVRYAVHEWVNFHHLGRLKIKCL